MPKSTLTEGGTLNQPTTEGPTSGRGVRRPYPRREGEARSRRRPAGTVAISIALHVVIGAALLRVLMVPYPFLSLFSEKEEPIQPERISFLALPQTSETPTPGRSGGNNIPETTTTRTPAPPLVAPRGVPTTVPPVNPAAPPPPTPTDEGTGPLVGRGGATRGIRPSYSDPRIWVSEAPVVSAPKSADARMDSTITADVERARDSAAAVAYTPNKFERGDWTVEGKDGQKYGMDTEFIRLGKVSIPLPLLALLPLNLAQGNPIAAAREREMASLRSEIQFHSARAMNEAEFRKAVKSLRERKERERDQQQKPKPIADDGARTSTPVP